jgi:hypothetical protein
VPHTDDRLRLIFTQIDAAFPEKEFSFTIKVDQTDAYQGKRVLAVLVWQNGACALSFIPFFGVITLVEACEPAMAEIPEYLACLNKSNDFSAFVRVSMKWGVINLIVQLAVMMLHCSFF